jgi:hypothetical protein
MSSCTGTISCHLAVSASGGRSGSLDCRLFSLLSTCASSTLRPTPTSPATTCPISLTLVIALARNLLLSMAACFSRPTFFCSLLSTSMSTTRRERRLLPPRRLPPPLQRLTVKRRKQLLHRLRLRRSTPRRFNCVKTSWVVVS